MASYIDALFVNGQTASDVLNPVVAGLSPLITWDYIEEDPAATQISFDIKIGTDPTNWGVNTFSGDIIDTSYTTGNNNFQYDQEELERGIIYYCQIRATNSEHIVTAWYQFLFTTNTLPTISDYYLSPTSPTLSDQIELNYTYFDEDAHEQDGTVIRWYKNNIYQPLYDNLCTLPRSVNSAGDSWTAKIVPGDGLEFGPVYETTAVVVTSGTSSTLTVTISPDAPNVDDILQVEYTPDDEYFDPTPYIETIQWYKNGVLLTDTGEYVRLDVEPADQIYVKVLLKDSNGSLWASGTSATKIIDDVPWYVYNVKINGLVDPRTVNDLTPILDWEIYKTTAEDNDRPVYQRILITKTPSIDGAIYDTGYTDYLKNSFVVPENILDRGKSYYIHVGAGDTQDFSDETYVTKSFQTAGSSWEESVSNSQGWTIEMGMSLADEASKLGLLIHDGTYFCSLSIATRSITFVSKAPLVYSFSTSESDATAYKTYRIAAKGQDVKVWLNNRLVMTATGLLDELSSLSRLEFGDIDGQGTNSGVFSFVRYSTNGAYGFGDSLPDENTFYFYPIVTLTDGNVQTVFENLLSWLPDDISESSKLIQFNENPTSVRLPAVTKNFSPISCIYIDKERNKYIGTANGVCAIYGEKHTADYTFITQGGATIASSDFDRITSLTAAELIIAQPVVRSDWFTIDTTTASEYDEYSPSGILYYSQRVHGQAWFDKVDNTKGWQVGFSLNVEKVEAATDEYLPEAHEGFGVYVNDGTYQEIIFFYTDRIKLFFADVFVPITNTSDRDFVIVGKDKNLFIYQKLSNAPFGSYNKVLDGSGLFVTPGTKAGNSENPKTIVDSTGKQHTIWHDDGNGRSQILYSYFTGTEWSDSELVTTSTQFSLKNPDIDVDSTDRIWVAYEDTSWGQTEISVSVKDGAGWNTKMRVTNFASNKGKPSIRVDSSDNVHVVWEDDRNGNYEIFWAFWSDTEQKWTSSGQFGQDSVVAQYDSNDPYQNPDPYDPYDDHTMSFRNPKLSKLYPRMWLTYEAQTIDNNNSLIYLSYYDQINGFWNSSGVPIVENGVIVAYGVSTLVSDSTTDNRKPSIASSPISSQTIITWEEKGTNSQILASVFDSSGTQVIAPTTVSSAMSDSYNASVGWNGSSACIAYESDNAIHLVRYASSAFSSPIEVILDEQAAVRTALAPYSVSADSSLMCLYDFTNTDVTETVGNQEVLNYSLIGSIFLTLDPTLSTVSTYQVSSPDTKEFAFGDFSDQYGIRIHWKDLNMYFGYDAKPYSISKYNQNTVTNWPDNRINDIFVDVFGNIIAATFNGLVYHNVTTGKATVLADPAISSVITTAIKWGGSGIWYAGTTSGGYVSRDAGQTWQSFLADSIINSIAVDKHGRAVVGTSNGIVVYDGSSGTIVTTVSVLSTIGTNVIKVVDVDENDIIWAGTDLGLVRLENFTNQLAFTRINGMRSSHVNDISIVHKNLRYIATATGVERMNGVSFVNFGVQNTAIINDNISSVKYDSTTNSLWVGSMYALHEIVFRDPAHEQIANETVYYTTTDISTEESYDTENYYILDTNAIQSDPDNPLTFSNDTVSVYLNKNKLSLGYVVDEVGQTVQFLTSLLLGDQIEVELSNQLIKYHDFNQLDIEKEVLGEKRTEITKLARSSQNQLFLMSSGENNSIMYLADEAARLPFTTILLDRDPPVGCLELLSQLTKTQLRFRIYATDSLSGVDSYMISNYSNFTSDGTTPLTYHPIENYVVHDVGSDFNNITDSLVFPTTVTINEQTYNCGTGSALTNFLDGTTQILYAGTSSPTIIYRYAPDTGEWSAVAILDELNLTRTINGMETVNNVIWVTTGLVGGYGGVYRSVDGYTFEMIGSVSGNQARGIAASTDGSVYFGSSDGKIYVYKDNSFTVYLEGVGDSIYDLSMMGNNLYVATGDRCFVYSIDVTTDESLIIFSGNDTYIRDMNIYGTETNSFADAKLFLASGEHTTIYKCNLDDYGFVKSYNSVGAEIKQIRNVDSLTLLDSGQTLPTGSATQTVMATVSSKLFKYTGTSWEFFYLHSENINDFRQYSPGSVKSVFVISNTKITQWTNVLNTKTVYLRLKDKAGNITPPPRTDACPPADSTICCDQLDETQKSIAGVAYSININDLKAFINEGRIVEIDEYGTVVFTYDSPTGNPFYSATKIDEEVGVYTSEVLNGSNDIISWRTLTWTSVEPTGTSIVFQVRSGASEDAVADATWSDSLVKDESGYVSIEHISTQYIQFRAIFTSMVRSISPSLSSVVLSSITSQTSHFFTTNFVLPSNPIKGILTASTFIPVSADIVFGINTTNSVNFADYQQIEANRLFTLTNDQYGNNMRIGVKLLSANTSGVSPTEYTTEYDQGSYDCSIPFTYLNSSGSSETCSFRAKFFSDLYRTQEIYSFFTGNDQTGWSHDGISGYPATGLTLTNGESVNMVLDATTLVDATQKWYVTIEKCINNEFTTILENKSFVCNCGPYDEYCASMLPRVFNLAMLIETEGGEQINLALR